MRCLCRGLGSKEIAGELGIGVFTIEQHIKIAKRRLLARNTVHAAVKFSLQRAAAGHPEK